MEAIAIPAANLRWLCFRSAPMPAAKIGSAGINHRLRIIAGTPGVNTLLSPPCEQAQVCRFRVPVDGEDQCQSNCCFRRSDGDREKSKDNARRRAPMVAIAPKGNEIEIGCIQHQFNANQHQDGVPASQRAGKTNRKQGARNKQTSCRGSHWGSCFSFMATTTAPISAAVSISPITSSGKTYSAINTVPNSRTVAVGTGDAGK